ncbi:hypothetical protein EII14_01035 [Alloprevotella sp. OH1205_COT-284]|uniref:golvesin C-terminal-like domain-containing protein n=1 Tax=Alloprevotella sp. OH1205_COT-284 TaxID=2491043 RepID=UPI000F6040A5|nr:N-acetylmuramoyl-L-alanine amidase [Alloprevotella sp. OH1205_COT-284]RRD80616.1 hypothetical protein EII14_01035 [Alloprevotella sp. OH1205_COT-284]
MSGIRSLVILLFYALALLTMQGQTPTNSSWNNWKEAGVEYVGEPWVTNLSRPYTLNSALSRRHLFIAPSHGRYYNGEIWKWQRPQMFGSVEDLLTQSFVFPYLIPMLENAGAIVYTPRERDPQIHEVVVDNDQPGRDGTYEEWNTKSDTWEDKYGIWQTAGGVGFSMPLTTLQASIMPFRLGTTRFIASVQEEEKQSKTIWTPKIPQKGRYAVYVSYATLPNAVPDALYTVCHAGGKTSFKVNQRMGGATWLYLGTFLFEQGQNERGRVELSNFSKTKGLVSADAVRFGGGMGIVERSLPQTVISPDSVMHYVYDRGTTSGLPRQLEGARYYAQWAGLTDTLYNADPMQGDYDDDIRSRSHLLNLLGGGSVFMPDTLGRGVPFELAFALHTDAGFSKNGSVYGTLGIATTNDERGQRVYRSGVSRTTSLEYAKMMLNTVTSDLSRLYKVNWPYRELRDRNYGETRSPAVPSMILELLAHQNYRDMTFAHDPNFKFHASRAIYKSILRYIASMRQEAAPNVQPLPVKGFSARLSKGGEEVELSWTPVEDPLEPSATPTEYVVYSGTFNEGFDNGRLTDGRTSIKLSVKRGVHHVFRVSALNRGGESFPSEPLSVYVPNAAGKPLREVLVVNAFDRLSGPARIETADSLGFDLETDLGVPCGYTTAFCGRQVNFSREAMGREGPNGHGYSTSELVGANIAGNRFEGVGIHTDAIVKGQSEHGVAVSSVSAEAFAAMAPSELKRFAVIDYVCGLQRDVPYNLKYYKTFPMSSRKLLEHFQKEGGNIMVSGSFIGSDMQAKEERDFLRRVLHLEHEGTLRHDTLGTFRGLKLDLPIYNHHNREHFACRQSDILSPAEGAFSAFSYGVDGYSAGVAFPGRKHKTITMGFPFECLADESIRVQAMKAMLNFLLDFKK